MKQSLRQMKWLVAVAVVWGGLQASGIELGIEPAGSISLDYEVAQIEYDQFRGLLYLREGAAAIHVYDLLVNSEIAVHYPTFQFTDMDLTPDNQYLFVADYGGEYAPYGEPLPPNYVHRYSPAAGTWRIAEAPGAAGKIEAVSADRVLLQELDQWVAITLNSFGDTMTELSRTDGDYRGDFKYDAATGRIYKGNSGISSPEIHVRRLDGDTLSIVGNTGTYGTAEVGGGTMVLSTNGAFFYYGRLQVEAMNVSNNLNYYPERIYAAADDIAFGETEYYDAHTGVTLGDFGFETQIYGVSNDGRHLWAFDPDTQSVHHYTIGVSTAHRLIALRVEGPAGIGYDDSAAYKAVALYDDGSQTLVTDSCTWSIGRSIFGVIDEHGLLTTLNRPGAVVVNASYTEGDATASDERNVEVIPNYGDSGLMELEAFSLNTNVEQIEYSPAYGLLCLQQSGSSVLIVDVATRQIIDQVFAAETFTDMDLTADSRYLFIADYGGERTGYGDPIRPHYVHRYDLATGEWIIAEAPQIAWKIEAVSPDRVLLQEHDQHVDMTLNSFGLTMTELSRVRADYYGDFEYDPNSGRVYHGSSGSSSSEVHVRLVDGDTLQVVGDTGVYGTADSGGGTSVLSTNGAYFYYGRLQIDAFDIQTNLNFFPDPIYAAADVLAFAESRYYDAVTGDELSGLGFATKVYGVSEDGEHLWAFESEDDILHHYLITDSDKNHPPTACIAGGDQAIVVEGASGATITLDGSCSSDADSTPGTNDDIVEFRWFIRELNPDYVTVSIPLGVGEVLEAEIPIGAHQITLRVTDQDGAEQSTHIDVTVKSLIHWGDLNCDGHINAYDIDAFITALLKPRVYGRAYHGCNRLAADLDFNGVVDAFDIDPFINCLMYNECEP